MIDDHWFRKVEKILEAMEIIFDATKIKLVEFQLEVNPEYGGIGTKPRGT